MSSLKFCAVLLLVLTFIVAIRAQSSTATATPAPTSNSTTVPTPTGTPVPGTICAAKVLSTVGQPCLNYGTPTPMNETATPQCALGLVCHPINRVCVLPAMPGQNCTSVLDCLMSVLPGQSSLTCISPVNKCGLTGLRGGQMCMANSQCLSNDCFNNACRETPLGGNCTNNAQCGFNRYCALNVTGVCTDNANLKEPCGLWNAAMGSNPIPCKAGFTCVLVNSTSTQSFCQANVPLGQACETYTGQVASKAPQCDGSGANFGAFCFNGTCVAAGFTGQPCTSGAVCGLGSSCVAGQCQPLTTNPVCNTQNILTVCNPLNQVCKCASATTNGTCQVDPTSPVNACATQLFALQSCIALKCNNEPYVPGDGSNCDKACAPEQIQVYCCAKQAQGPAFILPPGVVCATPTATPAPGPTGTSSPAPTETPKRSGASTVSMSFVAIILAVVAMMF